MERDAQNIVDVMQEQSFAPSRIARIAGYVALVVTTSLPLAGYERREEHPKKQEESTAHRKEENIIHPHVVKETKVSDNLESLLVGQGVKGLIHGSVPGMQMYVFTYGEGPRKSEHISLIPENEDIQKGLDAASRHQSLTIWGKILKKASPQRHILVSRIEKGDPWDPEVGFRSVPQSRLENLSEHLKGKSEILCSVHACLHDGRVLVVKYGGWQIPVHVEPSHTRWTKDLWSSDHIKLRYVPREHQKGSPHLSLKVEGETAPVEVIDSIQALNNKNVQLTGMLVWFPKSPVTAIEAWGIEERHENGISRFYALWNSEDKEDLQKIDALLRKAWTTKKDGFLRRSTSFYHPEIRIRVSGTVMQQAQNQGNPVLNVQSMNLQLLPQE